MLDKNSEDGETEQVEEGNLGKRMSLRQQLSFLKTQHSSGENDFGVGK